MIWRAYRAAEGMSGCTVQPGVPDMAYSLWSFEVYGSGGGPTPTPTPTPTPGGSYPYVTSDPQGLFTFSGYTPITINGNHPSVTVGQNVWNGGGGYTQTLYCTIRGTGTITAEKPRTTAARFLTFPNTGWVDSNLLDSYTSITSSWDGHYFQRTLNRRLGVL